ncbi:hypothetical protein BRC62_02885 [Halobacteriales archaeon QH_10_67_13]|nr:MAG: hypothetical protein BRC62_02885 [Halobacteriales archaeon QH_10_67_13]
MMTSTNSTVRGPAAISWYDLLLCAIPVAFVLPLAAATVLSVPIEAAVGVGAVVSLLFVVDALVVHPPADTS